MSDEQLIGSLIDTYKTLNMTILPQFQKDASGPGSSSLREAIRGLRDDELKFSQALKVRVTTGQPMPEISKQEQAIIGTESDDDTIAALISQFGTARESTLAMLRSVDGREWDSTEAGPQTLRLIVQDRVANDQRRLQAMKPPVGGS